MAQKNVQYGHKMVEEIGSMLPDSFAAITMADPWEVVAPRLGRQPSGVYEVSSMDESAVEALEKRIPASQAVLGVGGGAVMDMAKYVHWKRGIPLYLIPTIASVDAGVTSSIAVRVDGKVRYIGTADPVLVGVDYPVIQGAPKHLNRAGVGDILSIHTALCDWRLSASHGKDPFSEEMAERVAGMLTRMEEQVEDLRNVSEAGIKLLFELYNEENDLCERWGNSRPEEGSEHFFAYNVEYLTNQSFVHGELVSLGVYALSFIQENNPDWVHKFIQSVGVRYRLSELSISPHAFRQALLTLPDYVEREGLFYSVINEKPINEELVERIFSELNIL